MADGQGYCLSIVFFHAKQGCLNQKEYFSQLVFSLLSKTGKYHFITIT